MLLGVLVLDGAAEVVVALGVDDAAVDAVVEDEPVEFEELPQAAVTASSVAQPSAVAIRDVRKRIRMCFLSGRGSPG